MTRVAAAAAGSSAAFWETPGAAHVDLAHAGGAAYQVRLLGFLDLTLRPAAALEAFLAYERRQLGRAGRAEEPRHFRT